MIADYMPKDYSPYSLCNEGIIRVENEARGYRMNGIGEPISLQFWVRLRRRLAAGLNGDQRCLSCSLSSFSKFTTALSVRLFAAIAIAVPVSLPSLAMAAPPECWTATFSHDAGYQANGPDWGFQPTRVLGSPELQLCFGDGTGTVSGYYVPLTRVGDLTLLAYTSGPFTDIVDVYQIERSTGRFSYVQSRVSTDGSEFGGSVKALLGTAMETNGR